MVTDLVFERFPRLKMVSVEAGCGYAAYLMDRLDEKHDRDQLTDDISCIIRRDEDVNSDPKRHRALDCQHRPA